MAYLIIPVVCFVLLAGLVWHLFSLTNEKVWKGKIDDLDIIVSVLMAAEKGEPYLIMKVPRRAPSMKIAVSRSVVRLEIPLVTSLQRSRRDAYLAILRDLKLDAQISSHGGDHDTLEWQVEGSSITASTLIKDTFAKLLDVGPKRTLEFRVFALLADQNAIDRRLQGNPSGDQAELPGGAAQEHQAKSHVEMSAGCITPLAVLLLLPVPFMIAYLKFGYVAASAVLIVLLISRESYRRWKKPKGGFHFADLLKVTVLLLTGTTIYFNDPSYLQLIPTVILSIAAVAELVSISFNLPKLSMADLTKFDASKTQRILASFAIIAPCIVGTAMNECLRTSLTLDVWVWFFAFVRIELVFGILVSSMPLVFYTYIEQHDPAIDNDTDSP